MEPLGLPCDCELRMAATVMVAYKAMSSVPFPSLGLVGARGIIMAAVDRPRRSSSVPALGLLTPFFSSSSNRWMAFISSMYRFIGGQVVTGTGRTDMPMTEWEPSEVSTYRIRTRATKSTPQRSWHCPRGEKQQKGGKPTKVAGMVTSVG